MRGCCHNDHVSFKNLVIGEGDAKAAVRVRNALGRDSEAEIHASLA